MRTTLCDACRRVKADCLWTLRVKSGMRYVLCGDCRGYWTRCGHELKNIDPDQAVRELVKLDVEAGEMEAK